MSKPQAKIVFKDSPVQSVIAKLRRNFLLKPTLKLLRPKSAPAFWTMPYDTICREILLNGFYEKELLGGMCALVENKRSTVLDVGANIGNHSIFFSSIFDNVVAFEPIQRNCWILKANLHLNRISNVRLCEVALSDSTGKLACVSHSEHDTNTVLAKNSAITSRQLDSVEAFSGDEALTRISELPYPITLIKIDVEGHEPEVIQGLRNTIFNHKPLVVWEAFTKDTVEKSKILLEKMGYRYFYQLTTKPYGSKWINNLVGALGTRAYLIPLEQCVAYDGMNIGSTKRIL